MRIFILLLLLAHLGDAKESFITKEEYAKMLYDNPRGISCAKCHGQKGEGMVIARYKEKQKVKLLETTPIYQLDFKRFKEGVLDAKGIMPKYYLTEKEIAALYFFLQQSNKAEKKEKK